MDEWEAGINNSPYIISDPSQSALTHQCTHTHTQSSCLPKVLNHSSYLVSCSTQVLYCYWSDCCCTAATQTHDMIVKEANCSVMFSDGMKQTNIQKQTHTYLCNKNATEMTDITTAHQPPTWGTHTYTYSSHGVPANHQTVWLAGFYSGLPEGGREGGWGALLEDKQPQPP